MAIRNHSSLTRTITLLLFITLLGSIVFTIIRIVDSPVVPTDAAQSINKSKSDYVLMLLQCTLGLIVMLLPSFIERKLNLNIPSVMVLFYLVFLYAAIYLGEVRSFYYAIPNWDMILHTFSGFMLGCISFSFITLLNNRNRIPLSVSPAFVALFAFGFAMTLGVFWEFYEYFVDGAFGLNMQKFITAEGVMLTGRDALSDTMEDLMVDGLGALLASLVGYISLKHNKGWIEKLQIKRK